MEAAGNSVLEQSATGLQQDTGRIVVLMPRDAIMVQPTAGVIGMPAIGEGPDEQPPTVTFSSCLYFQKQQRHIAQANVGFCNLFPPKPLLRSQ